MKFFYIANIRLPTEKAHGIQIMEMCSAFAEQGLQVELVVPKRSNFIQEDPFIYHDVPHTFTLRTLPSFDFIRFGRVGFFVGLFSFIASSVWYALFQKDAVFYTRDELIALVLHLIGRQVAWEGHTGQRNLVVRMLILLRVPIVVITEALKELYVADGSISAKILVAPDGADIGRFNIAMTQEGARERLGLPGDKKIVLYKGHLYERKGAHTLARAALLMSKEIMCVFIGGSEEDVVSFRSEFGGNENISILGNKPRRETPIYQRAADLLVIPNSARDDISKLYTSPMKLFGYMASGVPIIASDLPTLREIIDPSLAYFFIPDDPKSLGQVIERTLNEYEEAKKKGSAALALAEQYSWQKRAQHIVAFIDAH